ncbi:hypothetical protein Poly30_07720 [Planctomycetes bacterium Poly30]|uniref:Uncharacterized protein n=1 Tax=Saltatorellus ferox TaxID=2528018 RepID=A0A518EMH5_9BACT|nr:hypothetical protein Poly30_07720 [Planctomycetes bacterium Poly30]
MRPTSPPHLRLAPALAHWALGLALVAPGLTGCVTTTTSQPAGADGAILTAIPVSRAWLVLEQGETVGSVVRYSEAGDRGRFLYVVRNLWDQDLGMIDERGRAWKRIPHEEDRWLGTGSIAQGVRQILETGVDCQLLELSAAEVEAATAAARAL